MTDKYTEVLQRLTASDQVFAFQEQLHKSGKPDGTPKSHAVDRYIFPTVTTSTSTAEETTAPSVGVSFNHEDTHMERELGDGARIFWSELEAWVVNHG